MDHWVLDKACLSGFLQRFLHFVYNDTITPVEHAGKVRGHFAMERNVRQGCLASGFLVTMAFDPIFRWLNDTVLSKDLSPPAWLQPTPCACAEDFEVSELSFRTLMLAIAPFSRIIDRVTRTLRQSLRPQFSGLW